MGFFYAMKHTYTTQTKIKDQYVVIDVYKNGDYLMEYYFEISDADYFISNHLPFKIWATEQNLNEISKVVWSQLASL
jgi:hypothetical protein